MKVRHRLLLVLTSASLIGAILLAAGAYRVVRSAVRERILERIRAETSLIAEWAADSGERDPQELARASAARLGVRVTLIDATGTVIGDSARDDRGLLEMDDHSSRPEIRAARSLGSGESFRTSATTTIEYFYSAHMLEGGHRVKYVRIALPSSRVHQVATHYGWLMVGVVLVCMLLLTAIAYAAIRRLSYPVEWMTESVERAAKGDFRLEVPPAGGEEVVRLAVAIRRLHQALLAKIAELDSERIVLASVISGMKEGLLLLGPDRRIRLVNDSLLQIFNLEIDPAGLLLAEVVRHPTVIADVEAVLDERRETQESVIRMDDSGRSFELHVTLLHGSMERGVLVLLFDITRQEALERVRREFVANVSHELRTPLTSIKASVETLLDGDAADPEHASTFLGIISKNTDHMGALIEDVTDLSLIETGAVALDLGITECEQVAREVVEKLEPLAAAREVEMRVELPSPFPLHADRRRLVEMLTNLVENALKFNRPGGHVWIRGRDESGKIALIVEDDGIGIPAGSRELIFHRFYQVDRDSFRESRGTGLGLAIVKHLMRLHGGRIRVESELGRGSSFVLEFPGRD